MANGHGGARKGGGRKKGAATKKTRQVADDLMSDDGVTPLEVLFTAMRHEFERQSKKRKVEDRDYTLAAQYAKDAAPYCHPRLSAVAHTGKDDGPIQVSDVPAVELARRFAFVLHQAGDEQTDTQH